MKTQLLNHPKQRTLFQERLSSILGYELNLFDFKSKEAYVRPKDNYSQEEKLRIVIEGQSGDMNIKELCLNKGISLERFNQWTKELLYRDNYKTDVDFAPAGTEDEKFRVVLEGLNGEFSVAEICRREKISHQTFLNWSRSFLRTRKDAFRSRSFVPVVNTEMETLKTRVSDKVIEFLESYIDFFSDQVCVSYDPDSSAASLKNGVYDKMICLYRMNDLRHINKHFESLNQQMKYGDVLVGTMETFSARKERIWINQVPVVNKLFFGMEFILKRILPKISGTKEVYFNITKGKNRLLSKAEALGRLVCCGFKIMDHISIDGLVYFVVQKEKEPVYDMNPSYGPVYAMPRLGKNGKIIKVYKLRTMHPYSEYLQDYIVRANGYADSGKPADDFRIPVWGKIMRRIWLDELPQLFNFIKGDLKLVGIRPVSERYFKDIPSQMQKLRLTQKPGCIPPYVSLNRAGNVMSVLQAEKEYLEEKIRNPYTTDTKYFFKALYNIIVKRKRSA